MRFGWLAAAAVALGVSAPVDAQSWVNYRLTVTSSPSGVTGSYSLRHDGFVPPNSLGLLYLYGGSDYCLASSGPCSFIQSVNASSQNTLKYDQPISDFDVFSFNALGGTLLFFTAGAAQTLGTHTSVPGILDFDGNPAYGTGTLQVLAGVPEPTTWSLLILGLGGTGAAMRRRPKVRVSFT